MLLSQHFQDFWTPGPSDELRQDRRCCGLEFGEIMGLEIQIDGTRSEREIPCHDGTKGHDKQRRRRIASYPSKFGIEVSWVGV